MQGRYGPVFPKTPANSGFTVVAKVSRARGQAVRDHGKVIEKGVRPKILLLQFSSCITCDGSSYNIGGGPYFMYQGYFDTDFDKYTEDAVAIFGASGLTTRVLEKIWKASRLIGKQMRRH